MWCVVAVRASFLYLVGGGWGGGGDFLTHTHTPHTIFWMGYYLFVTSCFFFSIKELINDQIMNYVNLPLTSCVCVSFLMKENELSQTCRAQKKCQSKKLCSPPPSTIEDEEKTTFIFFFLLSMNPQTERPCSCVIRTEWGLLSFLLIIKLYLSLAVWREKMRKRDLPYTHTHTHSKVYR